jgi:hypothetical protein
MSQDRKVVVPEAPPVGPGNCMDFDRSGLNAKQIKVDVPEPAELKKGTSNDAVVPSSKMAGDGIVGGQTKLVDSSSEATWLDDSAFVPPSHRPVAATSKNSAPINTQSVEDPLTLNRKLPIKDSGARSDRLTAIPPSLPPFVQRLLAFGCCLVVIVLIALVSAGTKSTNPATQVETSPSSEEQGKMKRRLLWKTDLQRRKEESDATLAALTNRLNHGVRASEVNSFNAEVKIAERLRAELEAEINDFNAKREAPMRYR